MNDKKSEYRPTGRVVVFDARDRVLLLSERTGPGGSTRWMTPGGAAKPEETHKHAALRELREELGLNAASHELHGPVATQRGRFSMRGVHYEADDQFFVVWAGDFTPVMDGLTDIETELVTGFRWWTADELAAAEEVVFPHELEDMVRLLLTSGIPSRPLELTWDGSTTP